MGGIYVTELISLDGVMQDPGGDSKWKHAGWSFKISRGEEGDRFKFDETRETEALLLGRVTYEGLAAAWPHVPGEFGDLFNNMPKYVVSSTLKKADWKNSTILKGDVVNELSALKQRRKGNIWVDSRPRLTQTPPAHELDAEAGQNSYPPIHGLSIRLLTA